MAERPILKVEAAVVIEKLDRLAGDLPVEESIVGDMPKHAFESVSVTEPNLLHDHPTRKLVQQVARREGRVREFHEGRQPGSATGAEESPHRAL